MQSYSLYQDILSPYFQDVVAPEWETLRRRCREIMHREETLKEIMEIVGIEGMQEGDRLVMQVAENLRDRFLAQNAYSDDAFCEPRKTLEIIRSVTSEYAVEEKEKQGGTPK